MRVHVNEPRRCDHTAGFDLARALASDVTDSSDAFAFDGDIASEPGIAGAINNVGMTDDEIVRRRGLLLSCRGDKQQDRHNSEAASVIVTKCGRHDGEE